MDMLFVMDPIESIKINKDTTFAFMLEAQSRGWGIHYCGIDDLGVRMDGGFARCAPLTVRRKDGDFFDRGDWSVRSLSDFRVVWMRKDPPVDMAYITATHVLDHVDPSKTLVMNRPSGLRGANEKTVILNFPKVIPTTMISADAAAIRAFVADVGGKAVVKPLDRMGGAGIFVLRTGDSNLASILETSTNYGRELVMAQAFVPTAHEGDKRVLLMDGEPLGAILRVPQGDDFRGNMAVGGEAVAAPVTDEDLAIVETVRPYLAEHGLWFVGLDVIGGRLTELNVTSPTGVQEMNRLSGLHVEGKVLDWVEERVGRA